MTTPASADFEVGKTLLFKCQKGEGSDATSPMFYGFCTGYIEAVVDSLKGADRGVNGFVFCPPGNATIKQLRNGVRSSLEANPQHLHFTAASLVAKALSEAFPCK